MRKFLHSFFTFLFRLLFKMEVHGLENFPLTGTCLLCSNHLSILDAPVIFVLVDRTDITALVASKHRRNPALRFLVDHVGGIWLNREEVDPQAIRAAIEYLRHGGCLGIAPEGTRSRTGALGAVKTGVAYLADRAGALVVPFAIAGTEASVASWKRLRRSHIVVTVGPAFTLPPVDRRQRDQDLQHNTDEIMCRIAAMLPSKYWGVYADHPRLKGLVERAVSSSPLVGVDSSP